MSLHECVCEICVSEWVYKICMFTCACVCISMHEMCLWVYVCKMCVDSCKCMCNICMCVYICKHTSLCVCMCVCSYANLLWHSSALFSSTPKINFNYPPNIKKIFFSILNFSHFFSLFASTHVLRQRFVSNNFCIIPYIVWTNVLIYFYVYHIFWFYDQLRLKNVFDEVSFIPLLKSG